MKLLYKFQVHMDQKKYHFRIFENKRSGYTVATIADYGKPFIIIYTPLPFFTSHFPIFDKIGHALLMKYTVRGL